MRTPASLPSPASILAVAAGGAVGTSLRYALNIALPQAPGVFPFTTLAENVLGAFLLGLLLSLLLAYGPRAYGLKLFLATGMLGAFTTFSAVSLEIVALGSTGVPLPLAYAVLSLALGLGAALAGVRTGRAIAPRRR